MTVGWTADDIPDQRGRVAVVTGANGGLGLVIARVLARKGALVVMAARNQHKAKEARRTIAAEVAGAVPIYSKGKAALARAARAVAGLSAPLRYLPERKPLASDE